MKTSLRNLFLSAGLAVGFSALAQPTLTATGINPVVGDIFTQTSSTVGVNQGSSGAGQTWNLSSITGTTGTYSMVAASSTTYSASFPGANLSETGAVSYYKTSSTAWQIYGVVESTVTISYSNPEDVLHYPFTFNNSYTDTWSSTFVNAGSTYYRTGLDSIKADGYGTITTPIGTFNNALRVHFVQNYQDSTYIGTPYVITYRNDEYMWYINGNHSAIAATYTFTSASAFLGNTTTYGSTYLSNVVAGIDEQSDIISSYNLFPNPASNSININLSLTENQAVELKLFNSLGAQVLASVNKEGMQGENNYKLDISTLPEGIYFVQLHLDGNLTSTKRFIVTK